MLIFSFFYAATYTLSALLRFSPSVPLHCPEEIRDVELVFVVAVRDDRNSEWFRDGWGRLG